MASLHDYLLVSGLLFAIGLAGVVLRRNIIIVFMCLELMLSAANLSLVAFSRFSRLLCSWLGTGTKLMHALWMRWMH